jgi:hypothetical protein
MRRVLLVYSSSLPLNRSFEDVFIRNCVSDLPYCRPMGWLLGCLSWAWTRQKAQGSATTYTRQWIHGRGGLERKGFGLGVALLLFFFLCNLFPSLLDPWLGRDRVEAMERDSSVRVHRCTTGPRLLRDSLTGTNVVLVPSTVLRHWSTCWCSPSCTLTYYSNH